MFVADWVIPIGFFIWLKNIFKKVVEMFGNINAFTLSLYYQSQEIEAAARRSGLNLIRLWYRIFFV